MKYIKEHIKKTTTENEDVNRAVSEIITNIKNDGDSALNFYNQKFDKSKRNKLRISPEEIKAAYSKVDNSLIDAMKFAAKNIEDFAKAQLKSIGTIENLELTKGVSLGQDIIPIDSALCYIPGGRYPLLSTALMLIIPAKVAGVKRVAATSPVVHNTNYINPATLVAMDIAGATEIYSIGGAQSIAAFTYGTDEIKPVNLIVGPGNKYVAEAKRQCFGQIGIDFVAGPSEVLIIADDTANAAYIASDLLAQSEHDVDASAILLTTCEDLAKNVLKEIDTQLKELETAEVAEESWNLNGSIILVESIKEAIEISNDMAPEHLEIMVGEEDIDLKDLTNYGSLFIGKHSAEIFGDYVTGTNHTLPTVGASRYTGGLSVFNFIKIVTRQKVKEEGVKNIAKAAEILAEAEGLMAHKNAATIRLKK